MRPKLEERWRSVPGLPERYQVSDWGRVRTLAFIDGRGFSRPLRFLRTSNAEFNPVIEGRKVWRPLAACVLLAFVGPPPEGSRLARHLDDDRANNRLENLAWGTDADNNADARRNGANFATYGHAGKRHSEETKAKLRALRLGKPHGRKMSEAHRKAITEGYRKRFPEKQKISRPCQCGCGKLTKPGRTHMHGHSGGRNNGAH